MPEQLTMDQILSDEKPAASEPAKGAPAGLPAAGAEAAAEPIQRPQSARKEWLEKEQAAQGRVRDPETGQFTAKPEAEPAKAAPVPEPDKEIGRATCRER